MKFPGKEEVERIRHKYPAGCEVELVYMNDCQSPPPGTRGKVIAVDDIGTVHVAWSTGSRLGIALGEDCCRRCD